MPTANNDDRSPSFLSSQARTTVEVCIDALCFQSTHVIDDDGGVYLKDSLPKLLQLREDQRARIEANYSAKDLHPDLLAEQLTDLYGADAQSLVERTDPNELSVVDNLTDVTAKIFKKEMKQRIHDWEGGFRAVYGREAGPHDKMRLRAIYELYKAVKNRVLVGPNVAAVVPPPPPPPPQHTRVSTTPAPRPLSAAAAVASTLTSSSGTPSRPAPTPGEDRATPLASQRSTPSAGQQGQRGATPGGGVSPATPAVMTAASSRPSSAASASSLHSEAAPPTLAALGLSSLNDAMQEKRVLKRQLHEFEDQFKQTQGRPPSKEDRRPFQREYHRYGELKAYLANMGQAD